MYLTKRKKSIIVLSIFAAILLAFIGGNALAKYQTQVSGQGVADIAKWVFKVNGDSSSMQTISLNKTYNATDLVNGKIAPGSKGSFDIVVNAEDSEVGVDYAVSFSNETNKPTNLKFKYLNHEASSLQELEQYFLGTINANDQVKTRTLTVEWEWDYSINDDVDTAEGIANLDYSFDVTVIGAQVLPMPRQ